MEKIEYLVGSRKIYNLTLKPYDILICNFLSDFSAELENSKFIIKFPDLKSLSFWCRKKNLLLFKKNYTSNVARLPVGLVFHISPSNIPTNFAYSLIFGILTGNNNIVKVPSQNFHQIDLICSALKKTLNIKRYSQIKKMVKVVRYSKNSSFTQKISSICNARLIWGGDKTIKELKKFETIERNRDLTFPDRYSFAIINTTRLSLSEMKLLVNNFYNDTFLVDQNACSSPHLIIWYGKNYKIFRDKFWNNLNNLVKKKYDLSESSAVEKYTKFCSDIIKMKNIKKVNKFDNFIHTIFLNKIDKDNHLNKGKWGLFYECNLRNINKLKAIINNKYQTLTYFGFEKNFFEKFLLNNQAKGIDRVVPIGRSLDMGLIWDGYEINKFLTRTIEIR